MFREKMAFFTSVKAHVPILGGDESEEEGGGDGTLCLVNSSLSSSSATPRLNEEDKEEEEEEVLKEGLSTETVNTITGDEETSSQNSTATPNLQSERFSYDVDPELGAFV